MKCPNGRHEMSVADVELRDEFAGRCYVVRAKGWRCPVCKEEAFEGADLHRFELGIVSELARHAEPSAAAFRRMRRILGFSSSDLAALVGVATETVSRWENGGRGVDALTFRVLGMIAMDRLAGRTSTEDTLRASRDPASCADKVWIQVA